MGNVAHYNLSRTVLGTKSLSEILADREAIAANLLEILVGAKTVGRNLSL